MKKYAPYIGIGLVILVVVIGIAVFAVKKKSGTGASPTPTPTKKKVSKPVNLIPFEERPYVVMAPTTSREVDVIVKATPKAADNVSYLAEYQFGTSLGGNEQFIDLKKGLPATKQFALYSRSAGGKTSFEEDVKGGSLRLDFCSSTSNEGRDGDGASCTQVEYSLKQDWSYYDLANPKSSTKSMTTFKTADEKFAVTVEPAVKFNYVIVYNSPGAPAMVEGKRLSEIYTLQASSSISGKKGDVSIEMTETGVGKLYGWDGKAWKALTSSVSGNTVTGTQVELMEAYVVAE